MPPLNLLTFRIAISTVIAAGLVGFTVTVLGTDALQSLGHGLRCGRVAAIREMPVTKITVDAEYKSVFDGDPSKTFLPILGASRQLGIPLNGEITITTTTHKIAIGLHAASRIETAESADL